MISCYMFIVPEACACVVHVRAWRCVMSMVFLHTHVDQRVVWHNISTLCFSMCVLLSLRFHGFGAVHCESLRVGMCVLSLSSLVCFCHCWVMFVMRCSLGVAKISALTVDMISNGTTKRINLFKAFVLERVEVNCSWCCGKVLLFL